jgi:uncharacterized SAM-binding protein YcdF (DUF218 family)
VRWGSALLSLLLALGVAGVLGVRWVGYWLVVSDPLEPADAVVVLAGAFPFRAQEAAAIHRRGLATEVWLLRSSDPAQEAALAQLGWRPGGEEGLDRRLLEQLGVPGSAIRVLDGGVQNTREEMERIWRELDRTGGRVVVVVTSKPHTRRVRATWHAVVGRRGRAIIRYPGNDPFNAGAWWRSTRDTLAVSREVLGLLNVWTGFPVGSSPQGS